MIDTLVNYTKLDKSAIIDLLPFILIEIRNYTNQYFLTTHHLKVVEIKDGKIKVENNNGVISVGDTVELMNSENNVLIYQVKEVSGDEIEFEQPVTEEIGNENIVIIKLSFKNVNLKTIDKMLKYDVEFGSNSGIKSQSLGGYSVEYATPNGGDTHYPIELYGGVNSLKKVNDDYAEYRRKGYVRL